jgi:hypothetical protein
MFQIPPNLQFFGVLKEENIQKILRNSIMNIEVQARNVFVQSFSIFMTLFLDRFTRQKLVRNRVRFPQNTVNIKIPKY